MQFFDSIRFRLSTLFRRTHLHDEIAEELRSHIELRADDLVRSGVPRAQAERQARLEFGSPQAIREDCQEEAGGTGIESLFQDLRVAIRVLRKSPSFTLTAVLTLAVAIGANAVVFGALNALILKPLNVPNVGRLYNMGRAGDAFGYESYPNYLDLRDRNRTFDGIAIENFSAAGLDKGDGPVRTWGYETSGNYFDVLGLQPALGRFYHAADERGPNSAPYVVLTYQYWVSHFNQDRNIVGQTVKLNKHPFTIIGVAPPGYNGTYFAFIADFFVPIVNQQQIDGQSLLADRGTRWISNMFGTLKPVVTKQQAIEDLNLIGIYLEKTYPKEVGGARFDLSVVSVGETFGGAVRTFLTGLMLLAALILLAACANLGSLFAARAAERSREVALRLALGSSRSRILRWLFTEALLVSLAGGALGLLGSVFLLQSLSTWRPFPEFPINVPVSPDANVYMVALGLALVSAMLFGVVPVRQILRIDPYQVIKAGTNARMGRRVTARDVLLAVQIALCAVLVTSSLVAVRGLMRSVHATLGVNPQNAMLADVDLKKGGYSAESIPAMQKKIVEAMKSIPGVQAAGLVGPYPPLHMGWDDAAVYKDDTADLTASNAAGYPILYGVSPEYFQAAGTALLSGRGFTEHDDKEAPLVAVVNPVFAQKMFGSVERAIGQYFKMTNGRRILVVGIAENGKYTANIAENQQMAMFFPILQRGSSDAWLVVRSQRDPQQLALEIRSKLHELDPEVPIFVQTWKDEMNGALFASRMATLSLGVLGAMGAMLSITGVFGMAAYSISKHLKELGIRIALGAQRSELLRAALGRAVKLLAFGSAAGLVLGILASRVLASIVYQATPRDPLVLAGVVLAMAVLGLIATWIPAHRALGIDPLVLLREE